MNNETVYTDIISALKATLPSNISIPNNETPINTIRQLLSAGANPNAEYKHQTILEIACKYRIIDIIKLLIEYKVDVNRIGSASYSANPICYLLQPTFDNKLLELLLKNGTDPNLNKSIIKPLFYACNTSNVDGVKLLLEYGADPNSQDKTGNTYLYNAIYPISKEKIDIVKLLLDAGADKIFYNKDGQTPLDYAKLQLEMDKHLTDEKRKLYDELFILLGNMMMGNNSTNVSLGVNRSTSDSYSIPIKSLHMKNAEDITILTIPKGTLLYNSFRVKEIEPTADILIKLMGGILPLSTKVTVSESTITITSCLDQLAQKFFYSSPAGGIAIGEVSSIFNATAVFETKRDLHVAVLMSPTDYHRLDGKSHPSKISCDKLNPKYCQCALTGSNTTHIYKCKYGKDYDVCIEPPFLHKHSLDGHIAIAKEDSYDSQMKRFDINFMNTSLFGKKMHKLNRILFDGGLSLDNRDNALNVKNRIKMYGLPEIVLHIFDTNWYGDKEKINISHTLDIPPESTSEDRIRILSKFLIDYNNDKIDSLGFQTPLRLLGVSTVKQYHNFVTGIQKPNIFYDNPKLKDIKVNFYINHLNAFLNGDLRFFFDTRTGFLVNEKGVPNVEMEDGSIVSFADLSVRGAPAMEGATLLEKSFAARKAGTFWNKSDCLIPKVAAAAAGAGAGAGQVGGKLANKTRNLLRKKTTNRMTRKNMKLRTPQQNIMTVHSAPKKANPYVMPPQIEDLYRILLAQVRASA